VKWLIRGSTKRAEISTRLDPDVVDRVLQALDRLAIDGTGDVRRLTAIDPPKYRLRVGKRRIRFQIDYASQTLDAPHVLRRDEAY